MPEFAFEYWNRVWELLDSQGKSLKDLAESIDVSYGVVRQWRTKNRYPKADIQVKIASCLNTTVEYLMTGICPGSPKTTDYDYVVHAMNEDPELIDIFVRITKKIKGDSL